MTISYDTVLQACVTCGGSLAHFADPMVGDTAVSYDACTSCGLVQMNPRPSPAALDTYYQQAYRAAHGDEAGERTGDSQIRRSHQQKAFIGAVPARHLDVGCSMGTLLEIVGAATQVGVEPGEQHRRQAEAAGIEVHQTIEELVEADPEPFDLITMSHVVEHLADPVGYLPALRPLLAPGGRLLVEVPYLYRSVAYEVDHLLVFTMPTLVSTLRAAGFEPVETRVHKARQGGLGTGRNLAVLAVPAEPVAPASKWVDVRLMRLGRWAGFAPQRFYRWRRRQQRMVTRNVRRRILRR